MSKIIQAEWESFAKAVLPPDAGPSQRREMMRAFFAGAWATLCKFRAIGDDDVSEEGGVRIVESMVAECEAFSRGVGFGN